MTTCYNRFVLPASQPVSDSCVTTRGHARHKIDSLCLYLVTVFSHSPSAATQLGTRFNTRRMFVVIKWIFTIGTSEKLTIIKIKKNKNVRFKFQRSKNIFPKFLIIKIPKLSWAETWFCDRVQFQITESSLELEVCFIWSK